MASTIKVTNINTPDGTGNITLDRPTVLQAGDIVTADIANDAITTVKVADDAVTIAKLAATGTASSSTFLRGDNAWAAAGGGGKILQVVNVQNSAVATHTTVMPADDTIHQNTEGGEAFTLAIDPDSSSNKLLIMWEVNLSNSATQQYMTTALFQDTTANALTTVIAGHGPLSVAPFCSQGSYYMTAGTASSTTFKIRYGCGSAGTTTLNGTSGGRFFGGTYASSMTILEIEA